MEGDTNVHPPPPEVLWNKEQLLALPSKPEPTDPILKLVSEETNTEQAVASEEGEEAMDQASIEQNAATDPVDINQVCVLVETDEPMDQQSAELTNPTPIDCVLSSQSLGNDSAPVSQRSEESTDFASVQLSPRTNSESGWCKNVPNTDENQFVDQRSLPNEVLPNNFKVEESHPFAKYYLAEEAPPSGEPSSDFDFKTVSLNQMQRFRNASLTWMITPNPITPTSNGAVNKQLATTNSPPLETDTWALYVVRTNQGTSAMATPLFRELAANDRPDLLDVHLSSHSEDMLNKGPVLASNYLPGDILFVLSLRRKTSVTVGDIRLSFDKPKNSSSQPFWVVGKFYLMKRKYEATRLITGIKKLNKTKVICAALDQTRLFVAGKELFHSAGISLDPGFIAEGDIVIPQQPKGNFLPSLNLHYSAKVLAVTFQQPVYPELMPTLTKVSKISDNQAAELNNSAAAFGSNAMSREDKINNILTAIRLGLSTLNALANKNRDPNQYLTTVSEVRATIRGHILTFPIRKFTGPPSLTLWTRGTTMMAKHQARSFSLEVENSILDNKTVIITARIPGGMQDQLIQPEQLQGKEIIVTQVLEDNSRSLELLPNVRNFDAIGNSSPMLRCIEALCGGRPIPSRPLESPIITLRNGEVTLSRQQSTYVHTLAKTDIEGIIASSPFGVGKTLMIARAALIAAQRSEKEVHVLTGMTNAAAAALANTVQRLDPSKAVPTLRIISTSNRNRLDPSLHSEVDYPVILPKAIKRYVLDIDHGLGSSGDVGLLKKAIQYLKSQSLLNRDEVSSDYIKKQLRQNNSALSKEAVAELFVSIYKPRILIATIASLTEYLHTTFKSLKRKVATIQVDEASQFPLYALVNLAGLCPTARLALVGDYKQLPPFADKDLPPNIHNFTVGNLLEQASTRKWLPKIDITVVHRCPAQVTQICSRLFYSNALTSSRNMSDYNKFNDVLGINSNYPLQVLDLQTEHSISGTSFINQGEAALASRLARKLANTIGPLTIGILCFYKAQAGLVSSLLEDTPFFVGAIDGSQGQEYDVTFVLTSKSTSFADSEFLGDKKRLNVALSRCKGACYVIINTQMARLEKTWKALLSLIPSRDIRSGNSL